MKPFPDGSLNLRARPEQTQSEDLSDASLMGELLVLPANVRLDWKVIARYKYSSLFGPVFFNKEKKFYNIDTWSVCPLQIITQSPEIISKLAFHENLSSLV